jgi:hypothetical protein
MMNNPDFIKQLMDSLNDIKPKVMMMEISHDPDCPRLFGKPCTCNPEYKAKELKHD